MADIYSRIEQALQALTRTQNSADIYTILEREQGLLLTNEAALLVKNHIRQAERSSDIHRDRRLRLWHLISALLQRAREAGIEQAIFDIGMPEELGIANELKPYVLLLDRWIRWPIKREHCLFLQNHLDKLLAPECERVLQFSLARQLQNVRQHYNLLCHLHILQDTRKRGGTEEAAREACINVAGGFVITIPPWLEEIEQQYEKLRQHGQLAEQQASLLQGAISRVAQERALASAILAELQFLLGQSLSSCQQWEDAIAAYHASLQIFTRERYPRQFARVYNYLGHLYMNALANRPVENRAQAIYCYEIALSILTYDDFPLPYAYLQMRLGSAFEQQIAGQQQSNKEQAIRCYQQALRVFTQESMPKEWADAQIKLATAYLEWTGGVRAENYEKALGYLQEVLRVLQPDTSFEPWLEAQLLLMRVYMQRLAGNRQYNIQQALEAGKAILSICTPESHLLQRALTQTFLIEIYRSLQTGNRQENLEQARACAEAALRVFTREHSPVIWASIQAEIGNIYQELPGGERRSNLEKAYQYQKAALQILSFSETPLPWAAVHSGLAATCNELGMIDGAGRREHYEQALFHCHEALKVLDEAATPYQWAIVQNSLSGIYYARLTEDKRTNLLQSIAYAQAALRVFTKSGYPFEWAMIQLSLGAIYYEASVEADLSDYLGEHSMIQEQGIAYLRAALQIYTRENHPLAYQRAYRYLAMIYFERVKGTQRDNLEQARRSIEEVLQVCTRKLAAPDWATAQTLLGIIFLNIQDDRVNNIEQAIACFQSSLEVCTFEAYPAAWATNQANLCHAYMARLQGDHYQNLEQAIEHGQSALRVYTYENGPDRWAQVQINLGAAYLRRAAGEPRTNLERAIAYQEQALRIYTRENGPRRWALIQLNLGMAYRERVEGKSEENLARAMQHIQNAQTVFTQENGFKEWAELQLNMGQIHQTLNSLQNEPDNSHLHQALLIYKQVIDTTTPDMLPLYWATAQWDAGQIYHALGSFSNSEEYRALALACYSAALKVFTHEAAPPMWALTQIAIGSAYAFLFAERGPAPEHLNAAGEHLRQALTVFKLDSTPNEYRQVQQILLMVELRQLHWEEVWNAAQAIYQAEQRLLYASTGITGLDAILKKSLNPSTFAAFALLRQGLVEQAILTLERGRALSLGQAVRLHMARPELIRDEQRRIRYIYARQMLQEARTRLTKMTFLDQDTSEDRQTFLDYTARCTEAQANFDALINEIRAANDPPHFLDDTIGIEALRQAGSVGGPGHALVYLAALPEVGGFALAFLNTSVSQQEQKIPELAYLDLPDLTYQFSLDLVSRGSQLEFLGGLSHAQALNPAQLQQNLLHYKGSETWQQIIAASQQKLKLQNKSSTFLAALLELEHDPIARPLLDKPYDTFTKYELTYMSEQWAHHFLRLELQYCRQELGTPLLQPVANWLQKLGVTSLTIIPCGYLAALPLASFLLEEMETRQITLPVSVAPSAQSLLYSQVEQQRKQRKGVYTIGDSLLNLHWGEAEAWVVRDLARKLHIESHVSVQNKATKKALVEALQQAQVVDFSCHGMVDNNNFLQSRLLLAGSEQVTLAEILDMQEGIQDLGLLILSACQTAVPDMQGAVDEVRSLASAILQAGAHAVLASLWPVDDRATFLLITRFAWEWFPKLAVEAPAAALIRAQRWLRDVTYRDLQHWETTINVPGQKEEKSLPTDTIETEQVADIPVSNYEQTLLRGYRYDADTAKDEMRSFAYKGDLEERPFADPIYWAGFQVAGW